MRAAGASRRAEATTGTARPLACHFRDGNHRRYGRWTWFDNGFPTRAHRSPAPIEGAPGSDHCWCLSSCWIDRLMLPTLRPPAVRAVGGFLSGGLAEIGGRACGTRKEVMRPTRTRIRIAGVGLSPGARSHMHRSIPRQTGAKLITFPQCRHHSVGVPHHHRSSAHSSRFSSFCTPNP